MDEFDVYIWLEEANGYADRSVTVTADTHENARDHALAQSGLENAARMQVFREAEDHAVYFDNVSSTPSGYNAEKRWTWQ